MATNIYVCIAIAMLLALFSSKLMKKCKLPNVTGYLLIGLLAGPYCLNIVPEDIMHTLSFIPTVALGFIALSIGAEFKLSYLKKVGKAIIDSTVTQEEILEGIKEIYFSEEDAHE